MKALVMVHLLKENGYPRHARLSRRIIETASKYLASGDLVYNLLADDYRFKADLEGVIEIDCGQEAISLDLQIIELKRALKEKEIQEVYLCGFFRDLCVKTVYDGLIKDSMKSKYMPKKISEKITQLEKVAVINGYKVQNVRILENLCMK